MRKGKSVATPSVIRNHDLDVEVNIDSFTLQGMGVGKREGQAFFIPFTIPGEKIEMEVTELKKNYGFGRVKELLVASKDRVVAPCPYFGTCGGCQLQHIAYGRQLELKRQAVQDVMERIGKLQIEVKPVLGQKNPWYYRNKVHFQVLDNKGRIQLGFFPEEGSKPMKIEKCLLIDAEMNIVAHGVENLLNEADLKAFNWQRREGDIRHVVLRRSRLNGDIMVVLVTAQKQVKNLEELAEKILTMRPGIKSVVQNINTEKGRVVLGRKSRVLAGLETITDKIGELYFKISPQSFYQTNPEQTEVLYSEALRMASLTGEERVIDLYSGIGSISLLLAQRAQEVTGFEVVEEAVKDAEANARLNKLANVRFISGLVERTLPKLANDGESQDEDAHWSQRVEGEYSVVVLDPPRKGCEKEALEAVVSINPERIVYVSCDAATLARDLRLLTEEGNYRVNEVQPVDMFPQTGHVECVVRIQRKK